MSSPTGALGLARSGLTDGWHGSMEEANLRLAEAPLAGGERDEGRALLTTVWHSARDMGARSAERRAAHLAQRTRVPLADESEAPGPLARLTAREREVLGVLATGASNKVIAKRPFMSEKTVGVHVSNVLAKLGVTNRGAAEALVREVMAG
jgi:DNA-binding NarL/FixJ family response regulator